ncbi:Polygalacturonase [Glycine soja]|uniref:Polygalacturonase n=1 Tax=Glycine soja TaxID=3848 RepID=A0A0B2RYL2_GLYSO|nr:Polygalacturonase [Glycine soja]
MRGEGSTIHNVAYADDVVRVSIEKVVDGEAQVPFPTLEIQYVRQAFHTFITWPTNLVKIVSHEESTDDPLRRLIRSLYEIYEKPVELLWDGKKFGLPNADASFFLTYSDVNEIISGDKCLNIAILKLWMMFMDEWSSSLGHASVYGFLEPQSIHNAKGRHAECQQYIETWVKESQQEVYLGAYLNHAMKTLKTTVDGKTNQSAPQWIEVKWFGDGTPLDKETITTICNKWEGKILEGSLGQNMEKVVKAHTDALWARLLEENAKQEKLERDPSTARSGNQVEGNPGAISGDETKGVGDKALNQLEKSISSKLEAIVARQIHAQFQTSSKQALQDTINSASSITQTLSGQLADGQRKLLAIATNSKVATDPFVAQIKNGLQEMTEDPTKELSRLISEGKFEEAFTGALHRSDVSIVSWLCSKPLNVSYIHGTLMPPDGPESWPKNNSRHQWLVFYRINGMSPEGSGLVDRRGEKWWDLPCKPHKVLQTTTDTNFPTINASGTSWDNTLPGPCDSPIVTYYYLLSRKALFSSSIASKGTIEDDVAVRTSRIGQNYLTFGSCGKATSR